MSRIFAITTLAAAALGLATLLAPTEPATAKDYEYCRQDWGSGMRSCAFDTMEQCVAMISGRGGSCIRNPVGAEASAALAYAPKVHARQHR